jgi:hypothetical protein
MFMPIAIHTVWRRDPEVTDYFIICKQIFNVIGDSQRHRGERCAFSVKTAVSQFREPVKNSQGKWESFSAPYRRVSMKETPGYVVVE